MNYIITKKDFENDKNKNSYGGKIKGLYELEKHGFLVPPWFGVSPEFFYESLDKADMEELKNAGDSKKIIEIIDKTVLKNVEFLEKALENMENSLFFCSQVFCSK